MNWIKLEHLLLKAQPERAVTTGPALDHAQLREQALGLGCRPKAWGYGDGRTPGRCRRTGGRVAWRLACRGQVCCRLTCNRRRSSTLVE
jgi:hypothetical protein